LSNDRTAQESYDDDAEASPEADESLGRHRRVLSGVLLR